MTITAKNKEFIVAAQALYGVNATVTRKEIDHIVETMAVSYPWWMVSKTEYRVGHGQYQVPRLDGDYVPIQPVVVDQPQTSMDMSAQVVHFRQPKMIDESAPSVPSVYQDYVPFGFHKDLVTVIKSKEFYPVFITGLSGNGKCLGYDTPVMMFDGTIKPVQDIIVGDILMGDDSQPRNVLSLARGREMMYKVIPNKGDPYVVNESHILSLKYTRPLDQSKKRSYSNEYVDICVKDWLEKPNGFKAGYNGYRVPVTFDKKEVAIDPYFLGVWLGDGHSNDPTVTSMDDEIIEYCEYIAESYGLKTRITTDHRSDKNLRNIHLTQGKGINSKNVLLEQLRSYDLIGNKHIPLDYKTNDYDTRMQVFSGLIDTDGHINPPKSLGYTTKSKKLCDDVLFLARSLGFAAYSKLKPGKIDGIIVGYYHHISISGDFSSMQTILPRKKVGTREINKSVLVTGIRLEQLDVDDYYGFSIDGNRRFLLGDFTVTHNTLMAEQVCAQLKRECIRVNISIETDESDLLGGNTLIDGNVVFRDGPVLTAMKRGSVLLIDEVDRGNGSKLMCLQGILEGNGHYNKKTGEMVYPKSGFTIIATANTKGKGSEDGNYLSQILDSAFLERFVITVEQEFPDAKTEKKILTPLIKDVEFVDELVKWADVIRKTYMEGAIDEIISTRRLVHIAKTYNIFGNKPKAIQLCIARFDDETKSGFLDLYNKMTDAPEETIVEVD